MTAALLVSMIVSFWMGEPGKMLPENPVGTAKQFIEQLDSFKLEVRKSYGPSFEEFVTMRETVKSDINKGSAVD